MNSGEVGSVAEFLSDHGEVNRDRDPEERERHRPFVRLFDERAADEERVAEVRRELDRVVVSAAMRDERRDPERRDHPHEEQHGRPQRVPFFDPAGTMTLQKEIHDAIPGQTKSVSTGMIIHDTTGNHECVIICRLPQLPQGLQSVDHTGFIVTRNFNRVVSRFEDITFFIRDFC